MTEVQVDTINPSAFDGNPVVDAPEDTVQERAEVVEETTPKSSSSESDLKVIGRIKSSAYGGFTKILSTLTAGMNKTDVISIEKGKLSSISGGGFLYCDMSVLFGENNFDIVDPQYSIKLLKLVTGGDEVVFIDNNENNKYLVSNLVDGNPQITVAMTKPDPTTHPKITKPNTGEKAYGMEIDPEVVNTLQTAAKNLDSQFFILKLKEESKKVASIATHDESFNYDFEISAESETSYKLFNPFPIAKPESLSFEVHKNEAGEIWIKTISVVGLATIEYTEKITPMGNFDTFSF